MNEEEVDVERLAFVYGRVVSATGAAFAEGLARPSDNPYAFIGTLPAGIRHRHRRPRGLPCRVGHDG